MPLRVEPLLVLLPALALAEPRSLTVVPYPLEFDPRPELNASSDKLKGAWIEAVREAGEVITPSRRELDAAVVAIGRRDCRTANDCLAQLAVKGAGLYALHAMLELSEGGVFTVTARVVRDDGRLMGSFSAATPRGEKKRALVPFVKQLLVDAVKGLGVPTLPAFKEAATAPPPVVVEPPPPPPVAVVPEPPEVIAPPPTPPTPVGRIVGFTLLGVGVAAAGTGGALVGLAQGSARSLMVDARGFLPPGADADSLARARAANSTQLAGLVLLGAGGAVAVGGLLLALLSGTGESPASVALVPFAGGLVATIGGDWP
ncbi:MAG: hypothetical protein JNJ54_13320 [Myxococcaceae bacterium]|nr:hypothetical protein [Myxococcaceae bacterium]